MMKIRSYEEQRDRKRVEDLDRRCEVGPAGRASLLTDTMGDPMCRIRSSPLYTMLVAEAEGELVGVIRGTIKTVTMEGAASEGARVGYLLGLRVSPSYRRRGIATKLVQHLHLWFAAHRARYAYMATEGDNAASLALFRRLGFRPYRTPAILVDAVAPRRRLCKPPHAAITISKLSPDRAECLYRAFMGSADFFPHDIDAVLRNELSLGTWVAHPRAEGFEWTGGGGVRVPGSWAMASVWNSGGVFKLRLGRAPAAWRAYTAGSRFVARALPCLGARPVPDFFETFGFYFVYGVHREGELGQKLVRRLWEFVRAMAGSECPDCKAVVTEVGGDAALRAHIPHSKLLSCPEDVWCVKPLLDTPPDGDESTCAGGGESTPRRTLFVDPREV